MACDLDTVLADACTNKFLQLANTDPKAARAVILQLLCNISGGGAGLAIQNQTLALDNSTYVYQINHGLSRIPVVVQAVLHCITNDANLFCTSGQDLDISTLQCGLISPPFPLITRDSVSIYVILGRPLVGQEVNWKLSQASGGGTSNPSSFNNFQLKIYYG